MVSQLGKRIESRVTGRIGGGTYDAFLEGEGIDGFCERREYHVTLKGGMVPFAKVETHVYENYVMVAARPMPSSWGGPASQLSYFVTVPGKEPAGSLEWLVPIGGRWVGSPDELADGTIGFLDGIREGNQEEGGSE